MFMNYKLLRYSLLSMLVVLCGGVFAIGHALSNAEAEKSYTITFKDNGTDSDSSTKQTTIAGIIAEGADYVSAIEATNVYQGRSERGAKLGTSSKTGSLTMTLANAVKPTKITFKARQYNGSEVSITVNGNNYTALTADFDEYTINYDGDTEVSQIVISTPAKRAYITEVTVYYNEDTTEPTEPTTSVDYYVVGDMTEWGVLETFKMEVNPDNQSEYMLTKSFAAGNEFKVVDSEGNWYPAGENNNYKLTKDGTHTIYFRPDGQGGNGWHEGYIYVDDSQATEPEPVVTEAKYYVVGTFNDWSSTEGMLEMTLDATNNTYTYTGSFEAGVGIKVVKVQGETVTWYPEGEGNEYVINVTGEHTIVFNPETGAYTISDDEATEPDPEPVVTLEDGYYLVGSFNNWTASADYKFVENAAAAGEYMLTGVSLTKDEEIKAVKVENNTITTWYPAEGDNYKVKKTGSHDIYFRPEGNSEWEYNYLYLTNEETTPATEGAFQLTSVSENGTIHFRLGDNEVTEANAGDQIVAVVTPNDGYAIDWSSVQVKAYASFTDAQTPLTNAPGVLQDVDWVKDEQARSISFTMPEANVRITVAYTVDKSVLEELITNAEELADNIEDADIKGALQTAIDNAKVVDQNANATVEDVAAATDALNDAMIGALRALDALKVEVTVPAGSYATMFLDKKRALETAVEGVKLYTITAVDVANKQVVLSGELTVVDSQTPFIIANEGQADATIVLAVAAGTPTEVTVAPEFKGTLDAKTFTADDMAAADYYTLHGSNFVWTPDAGTIGANKCWIELPKSGDAPAPSLAIVGGEGTTGINSLTPALSEGEGVYYDLSGRRVAQPTKGLYIINGKKVVLK